mmetsp:Transcript_27436/g.49484  ORF Transcript_27436/g.49484 Transcript_27436/m.49484 type:complete len:186 (+) Transcript_27436:17-574(+)
MAPYLQQKNNEVMDSTLTIEPEKMMKRKMLEPRKRRSAKRLRFAEFSQLVLTNTKSSEDVENTWYTKKDISQFKTDVRLTSRSLRETRTAKAMKYIAHSAANGLPHLMLNVHGKEVIRGIEHLISPEVTRYMVERRRKTITGVLEEQQAQKKATLPCQYHLAQVSEVNSSFSKEWCLQITQFQHA